MRAKLGRVQNALGYGRGGGVNNLGVEGRENKETVTASLCLVFTALVATATATPDWADNSRDRK